MPETFQRVGAISNAHVGRAFEKVAAAFRSAGHQSACELSATGGAWTQEGETI